MSSQDWLIRIEGVNFDATLFDTNDLSTIRGGSLALLRLDLLVTAAFPAARKIYSGASQAAFVLTHARSDAAFSDEIRDAIAATVTRGEIYDPGDFDRDRKPIPFAVMTIVVDAVRITPGETREQALERAEARNHARQFRQWTVDPVAYADRPDGRADPFDGIRPATVTVKLPRGKVLDTTDAGDDRRAEVVELSASVEARRAYGRRARQAFYRTELLPDRPEGTIAATEAAATWAELLRIPTKNSGGRYYSFADNFEALCSEPPGGDDLAESLTNKIAVVYADGNGFGAALKASPSIEVFSSELRKLRRKLLEDVLTWFVNGDDERYRSPFVIWDKKRNTYGLRIETLLWGGDEMAFVMPAWLAVDFVAGFFAATKTWEVSGQPLTHAVGVAVAHHKTPIRLLNRIAKDAADLAKNADLRKISTVTFDVFESLTPPDVDLGTARARVFGTTDDEDGRRKLARILALPADVFTDTIEQIAGFKGYGGTPFPRSQLYDALRATRQKRPESEAASDRRGYLSDAAQKTVREQLETFARRTGWRDGDGEAGSAGTGVTEALRLPAVDGERPIAFDVAMITQLWDYVHPLSESLPLFPIEEQ